MKKLIMTVLLALTATAIQAGNYKNFKVSTYIRAQDVARMEDDKFLKSTWETVSSQVDLDKIYLETHRDAFIVNPPTLKRIVMPVKRSANKSNTSPNSPPSSSTTLFSTTSSSST